MESDVEFASPEPGRELQTDRQPHRAGSAQSSFYRNTGMHKTLLSLQQCDSNRVTVVLKTFFWKCRQYAIRTASTYIITEFCSLAMCNTAVGRRGQRKSPLQCCFQSQSQQTDSLARCNKTAVRTEKGGEPGLASSITFKLKVKMSRSRDQYLPRGRPSEITLCSESELSQQDAAKQGNDSTKVGLPWWWWHLRWPLKDELGSKAPW